MTKAGDRVYVSGGAAGTILEYTLAAGQIKAGRTFTLTPKAALPLVRGATVALYVRATKDGDPALAGVSAARLVQVTVRPASAS